MYISLKSARGHLDLQGKMEFFSKKNMPDSASCMWVKSRFSIILLNIINSGRLNIVGCCIVLFSKIFHQGLVKIVGFKLLQGYHARVLYKNARLNAKVS